MLVKERIEIVQKKILAAKSRSKNSSREVCLIAVSKLQPDSVVEEGLRLGLHDLGENYVQELIHKKEHFFPFDVRWHLIGPLQTNKAKLVVGKVELIHTLDRMNLATTLSRLAESAGVRQKVLIQVNVAGEDTKSGVNLSELEALAVETKKLVGLEVCGLMTMPPFVENAELSRPYFQKLRELKELLNQKIFSDQPLHFLSMGTSQDFEIAVEEGATHVRVGSNIFGERS